MAGRATTTDACPGEAQSDARSSPPNADDIRATCAEMPTLAHGFRIERPSERMYFQRRRSFPSTDVHWLVDAERRVNEMRSCSRILRRGCPADLVAMQALDHRRAPLADRRQAPTSRHVPTCRRRRCGVRPSFAARERRAACPRRGKGLAFGNGRTAVHCADGSTRQEGRRRTVPDPWTRARYRTLGRLWSGGLR